MIETIAHLVLDVFVASVGLFVFVALWLTLFDEFPFEKRLNRIHPEFTRKLFLLDMGVMALSPVALYVCWRLATT